MTVHGTESADHMREQFSLGLFSVPHDHTEVEDDPYGTLHYDGEPLPRMIELSERRPVRARAVMFDLGRLEVISQPKIVRSGTQFDLPSENLIGWKASGLNSR